MTIYRFRSGTSLLEWSDYDPVADDPSLNGQSVASLEHEIEVDGEALSRLFLAKCGLGYIVDELVRAREECRIVSHPRKTNTCFEKAELLGAWSVHDVVKALYFERPDTGALYAAVLPETGCFVDRSRVAAALGFPSDGSLRKAIHLPVGMEFGTCSPFIQERDLLRSGGRVQKILFDRETLLLKRKERTMDDFSFGMDHRLSIQMNYGVCHDMLKRKFGEVVSDEDLLALSFRETFIRNQGQVKVTYHFQSLSYRIASFISSIHGHGDVSIVNDYVDEIDLPDVVTSPR